VAYALMGTVTKDMNKAPLGRSKAGVDVYLKDVWPSNDEVRQLIDAHVHSDMFRSRYADVFQGDERWRAIEVTGGDTYNWPPNSTYIQNPPYFTGMTMTPKPLTDITRARALAVFGDSITTDHISPAGSIKEASPAGEYLRDHQVRPVDFNQYGTRRGNHQVMMRGTFANIRIRNQMVPGVEGGVTVHYPSGTQMPIYDAAMQYRAAHVPLVIFAGKEYGTGSSRDWAAKGTKLLGVRAVVAQSFERIHRSNLIGMGVLPLQFMENGSWQSLGLTGAEIVSVAGIADGLKPRKLLKVNVDFAEGSRKQFDVLCRIDTLDELDYFRHGGILPFVLRNLAKAA
jgi:aconitate hydratase